MQLKLWGFFSRVFVLAPNATEETYKKIYDQLKTLGDFDPESMGIDFELANRNAFMDAFDEEPEIWYCHFHLSKNIIKKICEKNKARYQSKKEKEFATRCRCLAALAFVPVDEVIDTFEELVAWDKNHATEKNLIPDDLISYFEKNYIGSIVRSGRKGRKTPRYDFKYILAPASNLAGTNFFFNIWHLQVVLQVPILNLYLF